MFETPAQKLDYHKSSSVPPQKGKKVVKKTENGPKMDKILLFELLLSESEVLLSEVAEEELRLLIGLVQIQAVFVHGNLRPAKPTKQVVL